MDLREAIATAGEIEGLAGLEFLYPAQFESTDEVKELMNAAGLRTSCVQVDVFTDRSWKYGALASADDRIRKRAIEVSQKSMDIAAELGAGRILLWLGHDGYDYVFQTDYRRAWDNLINSLKEISDYRPDIRVSIEYKLREPRTHSHLGNMGTCLVAISEVGNPNLGVIIDTGHSLMAYENLAEMALLAMRRNALHGFHLNDCFRFADDDLILGTVHTWEFVELFYWMLRTSFDDWWTLDTYPYREDGVQVIEQSLKMFGTLMGLAQRLLEKEIDLLQFKNDVPAVIELIRDLGLKS
ncbi:MAG: TIM barrel protein [Firmicutes bacterium]|nr:TIM barrel protein [Bacillota bacterium]